MKPIMFEPTDPQADRAALMRLTARSCRRVPINSLTKGSTCLCIESGDSAPGVYIYVQEAEWTEERPVPRGEVYYVGKSDANVFKEAFCKSWSGERGFKVVIVPMMGATRAVVGGLEIALIKRLQPFRNIHGGRLREDIAPDLKVLVELVAGAADLSDRSDRLAGGRFDPQRSGNFAIDFRATRLHYSLNQRTAARVCRASVDVIRDWESGHEEPDDPEAVLAALRDPKRSLLWKKTDVNTSWAGQLRDLRTAKGLTQQDVASILKVTQVTISQWEAGRVHPCEARRDQVVEMIEAATPKPEELRSRRGRKPRRAGRAL